MFTRKRFRLKTQTFLYGYMFRLHENGEKRTKTFSVRKRYPKWKLLKMTTFWLRVNSVNDVCEVETDRFVAVLVGVDKRAAWRANA